MRDRVNLQGIQGSCTQFYLLCQFLKSEADIIEVTVMEVFREEKSVRRVHAGSKSVSDRLLILWQEYRNQQRS